MTRDLSAGRVGVAFQATVENKRLCMRNKILRSSNEGSNSGYAIKPKKPVKQQADTETRWNISAEVSLFYLFH